jgi:Ca-activated chloride channel homolog
MRQIWIVLAVALCSFSAHAQVMRGKVMMPDGSPPPQRALIERHCPGGAPIQETVAGKGGEFYWKLPNDGFGMRIGMGGGAVLVRCFLKARVKDLESDGIDIQDPKILRNLQLPTMILRKGDANEDGPRLPAAVLKNWTAAVQAYKAEQWAQAERLAREVARATPQFAAAWNVVGLACNAQKKFPDARDAFRQAIAADPSSIPHRIQLTRVEITMQLWADAAKTAEEAVQADTAHRHPEGELNLGIARYMLNDIAAARANWERYLEHAPSAANVGQVRAKLEEMRAPAGGTPAAPSVPEALLAAVSEPDFTIGAEATVPGGRKALAAIAHLPSVPPAAAFFLEYCRAIAAQTSRMAEAAIPKYAATLQQYLASVTELADMGPVFKLSLKDAQTEKVVALLGWRVVDRDGKRTVEPGDLPADGARQLIPRALGIDDLGMKQTLESGGVFSFTIESETAPVTGGAAWNAELRLMPALSGGIAEAFARDARLARAYAGLAALPPDIAAALVKNVGLHAIAAQYAVALSLYADTFRIPAGSDDVWSKLAGASPREPAGFIAGLLATDHGKLAAFYAALAAADDAHRRYFTASLARAERFYAWYRDSEELRDGIGVMAPGWRARVFTSLPIEAGRVRFPGGREAWSRFSGSTDEEILWPAQSVGGLRMTDPPKPVELEALLEVAELERRRGRPLDAESARLLARNFTEWRPLFPYFETLSALEAADFAALERFSADAIALPAKAQETRLGQWYSAAALIVLGRKSGALDDAAAAKAFGTLCRTGDAPAVVREISGGGADLADAVASRLLRLSGARRATFDHVRTLQTAEATSLSGFVYAAMLDPDGLLVNEDHELLRKHVFVPKRPALFAPASLAGSHFAGGFMKFDEIARRVAVVGKHSVETEAAAPPAGSGPSDTPETIFRASARLVEINATVTDNRGRLLDGLKAAQFSILDSGHAATIAAFENEAAPLSCVLLLDTSQSMDGAIAALKSAAMRLIGGLREGDSVAVYTLNGGLSELQPFTTDKIAATRAVLRAELGELTALYDGLVRVNRDLAGRLGKKVIVVLTDGEDTDSTLSAETAILRAKTAGVPIYTIAQGHAVGNAALLKELHGMSQATGGIAFAIRTAAEIGPVFDRVLQDLLHGYLLAFSPQAADDRAWRKIEVRLRTAGKVRAREGYYPE